MCEITAGFLFLDMENPLVSFTTTIVKLHYLNYIVVEVTPDLLAQLPGKFEKGNFNQRLIIRLDNSINWQCGMLAMGEGSGCISIQSSRLKKIGKSIGEEVFVELWKDTSEYGAEVAEELQVYWDQDPESFRRFSKLTPGMQRYVLNHVTAVKHPDKRLERAVMLMRNLLNSKEGKETFRELLGK